MANQVRRALDICSADDILAPVLESELAAEFGGKEPNQPRVFWYPTGTDEPGRNSTDSERSAIVTNDISELLSVQALQGSMKALLLLMRSHEGRHMLVQFWAPRKSRSGQSRLSVLGQPVGMDSMYVGFWSYRYMCMKKEILVGDSDSGPVGRVFDRGYPEYSSDITSYSREEFPMMDHAKFCISYMALPVFERWTRKPCIGVLEFLSIRRKSLIYSDVVKQLKRSNFQFTTSHPGACLKIDDCLVRGAYHYLRTVHKIPLVQIWVPCYCDQTKKVTKLYCRWSSSSRWNKSVQGSVFLNFVDGTYYVNDRKGVVGRAFSQKKVCYFEDTGKFSISDYPLVHLTRLSGLTACFAIPVQKINPKLNDVIVEVFLPPQKSFGRDYAGVVLKSLLSEMAESRHSCVPFELANDKEFHVQYSHSDAEKFVYFDVVEKSGCVGPRQPSQDNELDQLIDAVSLNTVEESDKNEDLQLSPSEQPPSTTVSIGDSNVETLIMLANLTENLEGRDLQGEKKQPSPPDQPPAVTVSINDSNVETLNSLTNFTESFEGHQRKRKEVNEIEHEKVTKRAREKGSNAAGGEEIDQCFPMIVKATYKVDHARFLLWSNSGIEELHKELQARFKLEAEKFEVKYKDDKGKLVLLSCKEDLHIHFKSSKLVGQTRLELLVVPLTD